ncbi:hypothetical protein [Georgenia alba]|uniref:Uncharacterized protein n=1 Tax=Georgenia alba TaxID=2233858 RepID=A0ABW2Q991_9MICO
MSRSARHLATHPSRPSAPSGGGRGSAPIVRRGRRRLAALVAGAAVLLTVPLAAAAFTDDAHVAVGSEGTLGGAYDIAWVDAAGDHHEGNPEAWTIDTGDVGAVPVYGMGTEPAVTARAVTTTSATGPVTLTLANGRSGTPEDDPGYDYFADPYDAALFTVAVDGTVVADHRTAEQLEADPPVLTGWTGGTPRTVTVQLALRPGLGNPYYAARDFFLTINLDGATS